MKKIVGGTHCLPASCSTLALATQRPIVNHRLRSSDTKLEQEVVLLFEHSLYLKPEYLPIGSVWAGCECGNGIGDANFLIVFHSWYESILLGFRNMTTGRTKSRHRQRSHIWTLRKWSHITRNALKLKYGHIKIAQINAQPSLTSTGYGLWNGQRKRRRVCQWRLIFLYILVTDNSRGW